MKISKEMNWTVKEFKIIGNEWTATVERNGIKVHFRNFPATPAGLRLLEKSVNEAIDEMRKKR